LGTSSPFILPQLGVPASTIDFVLALAQALIGIIAIVAAIAILTGRGDRPSGAARALGGVAVGLFVAGVALSAFQNATFENDEVQEGDVEVVTVDLEFDPASLEVDSNGAVFLSNDDPVLHTFTVDELDIDVDLPAGKTVRVVIDGDAGEYRFYCVPHQPDMEGTLTIR
jgi:plastocyanin